MSEKKTQAELLQEKLCYETKHICKTDEKSVKKADKFCQGYMKFLNEAKTERECVVYVEKLAKSKGFEPFDKNGKYKPGDKVYYINRKKSIILCVFGKKSVGEGVRLAAAHIDSPRLDLKPNPLYEDSETAFFKTHYYGGIKKYQWTAIPLSLRGVILKSDGSATEVSLGEKEGEPKFVITDLLPHLSAQQNKRTLSEGIKGEELNVLIGSRPFKSDKGNELVKLNVLKLLNDKYGIVEKDFLSAELTLVPAFPACDIGFDKSMIGSYGHDDRVCSYPAAMALFDAAAPEYTAVTVLTDKEEIGSEGNTGLNSAYLKYFIADLARLEGLCGRDVLSKSLCLSADVNAAFDPTFPEVTEKRNTAFINHGVCVTKYTGARGKSGTSDASAEFMNRIARLLDENKVCWQTGELGKVDEGGGGTVAMYIAALDVDVIDIGVPVLSMHSPYEVVSKLDVYMAYKAFLAFFEDRVK